MNMFRAAILAGVCATVPGCAGLVTAWKNDPLQSYDVVGPSVYAMTGDRRTAIFTRTASDLKYCAESLPDAVAAVAASSRAELAATSLGKTDVKAGFIDTTTVGLLQTFQRTEIAEISRQLGWTTCLAWSQGGITNAEYRDILVQIVTGSIDVMRTRANQTVTHLPGGTIVVGGNAPPDPLPAPTPTQTPTPTPTATATPVP